VKKVTTGDPAGQLGISRATLQAWIASGTVRAPEAQIVDGVAVRIGRMRTRTVARRQI
jgi:predicted site-specific integrase-resolvase